MENMKMPAVVNWSDEPVLTTAQLAEFYECSVQRILQNFNKNKDRFVEGKHYFKLEGENLKTFRSCFDDGEVPINKFTTSMILWTKRGCARHAKILTARNAWEVFELLEENYFEGRKEITSETVEVPQSLTSLVNEVIGAATAIENYLGVPKEWAFIHSAAVASTHYGVDLTPFKQLNSADKNSGYMNATQAAEACHEKGGARQFNKVAERNGYQYKDSAGNWHLTEKGKPFADIRFFEVTHVNGGSHQGTQILWKETMIAEYERAVQDEKVCDNLFEGL